MDWVYLAVITLIGATIQSATGFGFGLIAVPIFLLILNSTDAIHMVMIIIFCMSILDWLKLRGKASSKLLLWLSVGMLAGFPIGLYIFQQVNLSSLKLFVAITIMLFSLSTLYNLLRSKQTAESEAANSNNKKTFLTGIFSGAMSTSLAMPGPIVMMYFVQQQFNKTIIRATILTYFIFAYAGALVLQSITVGIAKETWLDAALLVPIALIGVVIGHLIAPKINQKQFKKIVLFILILMSFVMLYQL